MKEGSPGKVLAAARPAGDVDTAAAAWTAVCATGDRFGGGTCPPAASPGALGPAGPLPHPLAGPAVAESEEARGAWGVRGRDGRRRRREGGGG